ncbi:TetR/AcrR family transcriptional regulator [Streptomyces sp. ME01-24h]|nr:TetR/AcrR family transcriptional regulator [Streptomyces sp. ME19-03-3]MDX3214459.1 TetR/AcrR family transcriptional regulator [Streptomyces sp. ME02-6991-2B]MDX3351997.1 TetR/AcrR family transcriptional regulator [Streptomyces sp. ME01-24h]
MTVTPPARSPRRRVPRNTLNPDRILGAAVALLDRHGAEAFTMRALAQELGVGTMAVYSHFKGKDEIIDAVNERLLGEIDLPLGPGAPREQLSELCLGVYRLFTEHPSALQSLTSRPLRGDEAIAAIDRMLGLLIRAGLDPSAAVRAQVALMQYTIGAALWAVRRKRAECEEAESGLRERIRSRLADLPPDTYPSLAGLAPELVTAQQSGRAQYEAGLSALLDGLLRG